jgi:hypothetical protein
LQLSTGGAEIGCQPWRGARARRARSDAKDAGGFADLLAQHEHLGETQLVARVTAPERGITSPYRSLGGLHRDRVIGLLAPADELGCMRQDVVGERLGIDRREHSDGLPTSHEDDRLPAVLQLIEQGRRTVNQVTHTYRLHPAISNAGQKMYNAE